MKTSRKRVVYPALLAALVLWQSSDWNAGVAQAARRSTQSVEQLPIPVPAESSPATAGSTSRYHTARPSVWCPCIHYRAAYCNRCFGHSTVKATLLVEDPACCGCFAKVPVCLPARCQGEASICPRMGVLGRRRVTYTWACGFSIDVLFRTRGDLVVTY